MESDDDDYLLEDESDEDDHLLENGSEENGHRLEHQSENDEIERSCDEDSDSLEASGKKQVSKSRAPLFTEEDYDAFDNKQVSRFRLPSFTEEEKEDMAVLTNWKPSRDFRADVEADFFTFMDREKSRGECLSFLHYSRH